jgi:hypothetical protein
MKLGKIQVIFSTAKKVKPSGPRIKTYTHETKIPNITDVDGTKYYKVTKTIVHIRICEFHVELLLL